MIRFLQPLLPALLIAYLGFWGGTLAAVGGYQALILHVVLLAGIASLPRLGVPLSGLVWALTLSLAGSLSLVQSEVPRAGQTAKLLLPAFLILPWIVAALWRDPVQRARGLTALAAVVATASAWAIVDWLVLASPGAAAPLGHHNVLAHWLLALLPLVLDFEAARRRSWLVAVLGGSALLLTFSRTGLVVGLILVLVLAPRWRGRIALGGAVGLTLLLWLRPIGLFDLSTSARWSYLEAAWRGFLEQPLSGWGLGSTAWLGARFLRPVPGLHPPSHLVPDWHSLPAQLLFEVGLFGTLIVIGVVIVAWRAVARAPVLDIDLRRRALAALLGFGLFGLTGLPWAVPALPLALAVVVGALVTALAPSAKPISGPPWTRWMWWLVALLTLFAQLPRDLAQIDYDRALEARDVATARRFLERAVARDPEFPLYRWRLALLEEDPSARLDQLREVAKSGVALAPFWLSLGLEAKAEGGPEAEAALIKACDLDPFAPLAPFELAQLRGDAAAGGRALLAEPILVLASDWQKKPELRRASVDRLRETVILPIRWRAGLERLTRDAEQLRQESGRGGEFHLEVDRVAAESLSLRLFRRRPWPLVIGRIEMSDFAGIAGLDKATELATTPAELFGRGCRLGDWSP